MDTIQSQYTLDTPIQSVSGIGPRMSQKLSILGITTVEELLFHIPFRYDDFSHTTSITHAKVGETVTIRATVSSIGTFTTKTGKKMIQASVKDETGSLPCIWFNQVYLLTTIRAGMCMYFSGKIQWFGNKKVLLSPQYEFIDTTQGEHQSLHTGRLVPVYSETEGLTSKWLRSKIAAVLTSLQDIPDYMPSQTQIQNKLMSLKTALTTVHFPQTVREADEAKRRLAFDEFLLMLVNAYEEKRHWEMTHTSPKIGKAPDELEAFISTLPFTPTSDQKQAMLDIQQNLTKTIPMNRLLVGDVGSGKTVVAATALYLTAKSGFTGIIMAPTQILAQQHYASLSTLLTPHGIGVGLVTASQKDTEETEILPTLFEEHKKQPLQIFVGTHALLSAKIPGTLGLVIVDEQQRFGVRQRTQFLETKKNTPHFLTMTATPIPRTIARTMLGNIAVSTLTTMPKGRQRIRTWVVPSEKRKNAYEWIRSTLKQTHGQAYVLCPLIDESTAFTDVKAVQKEYDILKTVFPEYSIGLLHGRMLPKQKTEALRTFSNGETQILVTTPVIEVGIDVPNACIMLIEGSERFGLSQLHQLRGRVGRGKLASYCLLFTESTEEQALTRLKALETIENGPELADIDLKMRGPGDLFGTKQHGAPLFSVASFSDTQTLSLAEKSLHALVEKSQDLSLFPLLREKAKKSIIQAVHSD